jgi:hypothetical protein
MNKDAHMRTTRILSLSLPPELLRDAERIAKEEGRTKTERFREAFAVTSRNAGGAHSNAMAPDVLGKPG